MLPLDDAFATVDALSTRLGSPERATALLRELKIPVVQGTFSQRLLLERLENTEAVDERAEPAAIVAGILRSFGIRLLDYQVGRPTIAQLIATTRPVPFGFSGSKEPLFAPVVISTTEPTAARIYTSKARIRGKAGFSISGFLDELPVPLSICILLSERRAWGATAGELRYIYRKLPGLLKRKHGGTLTSQFVILKNRDGAMRAAFPKAPGDWDLDMRLT